MALCEAKFTIKWVFTSCRDINFLNPPLFQCASQVSACTPQCYRFNSILFQHLLSWLEEYPWTKMEIALACLTMLLHCNHSVEPSWWYHISLDSSRNNLGISWLWNPDYNGTSDQQFFHPWQTFLQCPKYCHHLSIGEFTTTGHFTHLCAQIVLNSCLGFTDSLKLMYFLLLFFLEDKVTYLCKVSWLPSQDAANAPGYSWHLQLPQWHWKMHQGKWEYTVSTTGINLVPCSYISESPTFSLMKWTKIW